MGTLCTHSLTSSFAHEILLQDRKFGRILINDVIYFMIKTSIYYTRRERSILFCGFGVKTPISQMPTLAWSRSDLQRAVVKTTREQ